MKIISSGHSPNIARYTPGDIFEGLNTRFDLDPCAPDEHCPSKDWCNGYYSLDRGQDGLELEWFGLVWLNPPFARGEVGKWIRKAKRHKNTVCLVTSYFTSSWFQNNKPDGLFLLADRPRYIVPKKDTSTVTGRYPSMLMAYGKKACSVLEHCTLKGHYYESY